MSELVITTADLRTVAGEPRIMDEKLGAVLGFARARNVRKIIRSNARELQSHGTLHINKVTTPSQIGRPSEEFHLNEAQAILICMFSRTNAAAEVRRQIVQVFMSWRRGDLKPVSPKRVSRIDPRWDEMDKRHKIASRAAHFQDMIEGPDFHRAIAYFPPIWPTQYEGRRTRQARPVWWGDHDVRQRVISLHRQMTMKAALAVMAREFEPYRLPSKSSIGRFWLVLDQVREAA